MIDWLLDLEARREFYGVLEIIIALIWFAVIAIISVKVTRK